jgi:hypothetical protein
MRNLVVAVVVLAWTVMACGGGSKPPMQPDNDPTPAADGGAEPSAPAPH